MYWLNFVLKCKAHVVEAFVSNQIVFIIGVEDLNLDGHLVVEEVSSDCTLGVNARDVIVDPGLALEISFFCGSE
jgi:hypothetical protein